MGRIYGPLADPSVKATEYYSYQSFNYSSSTRVDGSRNCYVNEDASTHFVLPPGFCDNPKFTRSYKKAMRRMALKYQENDMAQEKEALVANLRAADSLLTVKPTFFNVIRQKYDGDVRRYVDALFENSFMTSKRKLKKFLSRPRAEKLREDLALQFATGLQHYRLMLEQCGITEKSRRIQSAGNTRDASAFQKYLFGKSMNDSDLLVIAQIYESFYTDEVGSGAYYSLPDFPAQFANLVSGLTGKDAADCYGPFLSPAKANFPKIGSNWKEKLKNICSRYAPVLSKQNEATLARDLQAFDSLSGAKPVFFSAVRRLYGSDFSFYASHLCSKSILSDPKRLRRFLEHPTSSEIQTDLGVQFVIGIYLYDLWIKKASARETEDHVA